MHSSRSVPNQDFGDRNPRGHHGDADAAEDHAERAGLLADAGDDHAGEAEAHDHVDLGRELRPLPRRPEERREAEHGRREDARGEHRHRVAQFVARFLSTEPVIRAHAEPH